MTGAVPSSVPEADRDDHRTPPRTPRASSSPAAASAGPAPTSTIPTARRSGGRPGPTGDQPHPDELGRQQDVHDGAQRPEHRRWQGQHRRHGRQRRHDGVGGLTTSHHDLTAIPGGFATMLWNTSGMDAPCSLVERADDGTMKTIIANLNTVYNSSTFHTNSIHYYPSDNTYTLGDRNPNLYVKVSRTGQLIWQLGGTQSEGREQVLHRAPRPGRSTTVTTCSRTERSTCSTTAQSGQLDRRAASS